MSGPCFLLMWKNTLLFKINWFHKHLSCLKCGLVVFLAASHRMLFAKGLFRGRYRLEEEVRMGNVKFRAAHDMRMGRDVLLRITEDILAFKREVALYQTLRSDYVAELLDFHEVALRDLRHILIFMERSRMRKERRTRLCFLAHQGPCPKFLPRQRSVLNLPHAFLLNFFFSSRLMSGNFWLIGWLGLSRPSTLEIVWRVQVDFTHFSVNEASGR